jgi:hypothetical protein
MPCVSGGRWSPRSLVMWPGHPEGTAPVPAVGSQLGSHPPPTLAPWLPAPTMRPQAFTWSPRGAATAAVLNGVGVAPVTGECPGGDGRTPVTAVLRGDASKMAQPGGASEPVSLATSSLTSVDVVGRDGIEPPTLRFSAARSTD